MVLALKTADVSGPMIILLLTHVFFFFNSFIYIYFFITIKITHGAHLYYFIQAMLNYDNIIRVNEFYILIPTLILL